MNPETLNQIAEGRKREFTDAWLEDQERIAYDNLLWPEEDDAEEDEGPTEFTGLTLEQEKILEGQGEKIDYHLKVLREVAELTKRKRAGYAPGSDPFANFRMSTMFGVDPLDGILVRMTDKMSRVASLRRNPQNDQVNESLRETLLDLGNYAFIGVAYMDEEANR